MVVLDSGAQTFEYRFERIFKTSKFEIVSPLPYQPNKKVEADFKVAKIQLKKVKGSWRNTTIKDMGSKSSS